MELVIKLAVGGKLADPGPARRTWVEAIGRLGRAPRIPLIPPYCLIEADRWIGMAMPFGAQSGGPGSPGERRDGGLDVGGDPSRLLATWRDAMGVQLGERGLTLNDLEQIRWWRGVPFLVDLSDIETVSPRGL